MHTLFAHETNGNIFFSQQAITTFQQASIQNVPLIKDTLVMTKEGLHVADKDQWVAIQTVESLISTPKSKDVSGSVDKVT